jgi:glycosyltransferase involved in cell wall biosynthesis
MLTELKREMRILFCNYEYPPLGGGGGVLNAMLAAEMAKRHEVTVLTSQGLGLPRESIDNGLRIVRAPVFFRRQEAVANLPSMLAFMAMGIVEGRKLLRNNSFDIISTQFVVPTGPVGDALSRFAGIPNVLTLHGGDLYDPSKLMSPHRHRLLRAWVSRLLRRASLVVGDSRDNLDNMPRSRESGFHWEYKDPKLAGSSGNATVLGMMRFYSLRWDASYREKPLCI